MFLFTVKATWHSFTPDLKTVDFQNKYDMKDSFKNRVLKGKYKSLF